MITLFGATGFIGSHIADNLKLRNVAFYSPARNEDLKGKILGDVIFCIGLTGDAKSKPFETVDAHINKLKYIIEHCTFNSITYCSSTRIYIHNQKATKENALINIDVHEPFELFNLTKLTAESLLVNTVKNYKIIRLSNIVGDDYTSDNFITSIIKDALTHEKIIMRSSPLSEKDYLHIDDAASIILEIAEHPATLGIYNVASGFNITNDEILKTIKLSTGCDVEYSANAAEIIFAPIDISRVKTELKFNPKRNILTELPGLINSFKKKLTDESFA